MLIDEATIIIKAGKGGNGAVSFRRNAQTARGGPDGGNGGNGGNVYLQGINDITALGEFRYKKEVHAEDGIKGGKKNLFGRNGKDLIVFVPLGTQVTNTKDLQSFEITTLDDKVLIAKGGKGGRGNNEFKSATVQAPKFAEKGEPGEEKRLYFEMKLIADIGLIGLPNAGKSSLLSVLTNAHPKIGDYPFTTLEPNLGVMERFVLADIPGLIEGASQGKGLGDKFLRHVEKTRVLIHCLDLLSTDLAGDYQTVRQELKQYNPNLLGKKELLVLTKADMVDQETLKKSKKQAEKLNKDYLVVSIYNPDELVTLKAKILEFFQN